ncbi:GNAT family N-acetyltransferase [Sporolactobacillus terrae]|uniref:N-acetyltransferase n=1 Tax=Sporolactobacillus terrae TaxID=269673 RepID=A0A5K7WSP0_9BACL|nr:GNAT family N-acetyltransferase [Sporolactobacillus terrae]BBN97691.1 N-acetyltransferase [Sporolactobacillus terrae]
MEIRKVRKSDLAQLVELENSGFTPEEAATKQAFITRIETIPDTFLVAEEMNQIIGYVNGPVISMPHITDDLFEQTAPNPDRGGYQSILGLVVAPNCQGKGIASQLLRALEDQARENERLTVTLTCRQFLIPFYEKNGYINQGIAASEHGGMKWFNMDKPLNK